ncbi:MAG: hypothetical protein KH054_10800 [Firmicutes bacterium]|jgi:hypothetical protein|nr:hypothetical protein [Clostridia bacterium]MBS5023628.1 hypothetical protein [Bacillota bacterium]
MNTKAKIKETELKIGAAIKGAAPENQAVQNAFRRLKEYYSMTDYLKETKHSSIIEAIYLDLNWELKGAISLALNEHTGERTLYRYRAEYLKCFCRYYETETGQKLDGDYAKLLSLI